MSNDTHVTDICWPVHEGPNLVYRIETLVPALESEIDYLIKLLAYGKVTRDAGQHNDLIKGEARLTPWCLVRFVESLE